MPRQWLEVVKLAFRGNRFEDNALDVEALGEISQFQRIVRETARYLLRRRLPQRRRLPRGFDARTRLCLRRIMAGSAIVPLEVLLEEERLLPAAHPEVEEAVELVRESFRAAERDEPLPRELAASLVAEYYKWGVTLKDDEAIEVITVGQEPARVTPMVRQQLAAYAEGTHEAHVDVTGEVLEADLHDQSFEVWMDDGTCVPAAFPLEHEEQITGALRDHRTLRVRVRGRGEYSPTGQLRRITHLAELQVVPMAGAPYDPTVRPIQEIIKELGRQIPREEWDRLPPDLTDNLDHYLYGTPRR